MSFDTRTEQEKKDCEKIYKAVEDFACDLIHFCRADSMNDVEYALNNQAKEIHKRIGLIGTGVPKR